MTIRAFCVILASVIEAWLSLVERCVRDAEAASSNLVASILKSIRPDGQVVKTTASHAVIPSSTLGQVTEDALEILQSILIIITYASVAQSVERLIRNQ